MIRDAAYDSLPKATRAELHERFAAWLEGRGADVVDVDGLVGYHLEQACRYRAELGSVDDEATRDLARVAARRLGAAENRLCPNLAKILTSCNSKTDRKLMKNIPALASAAALLASGAIAPVYATTTWQFGPGLRCQ